jgi:hypothetical protein
MLTRNSGYKDPTPYVGGMGAFPIMRRAGYPTPSLNLTLDDATIAKTKEWLDTSIANTVISKDMGYTPEASLEPKFLDYKEGDDCGNYQDRLGIPPLQ